MTDETDEEPLHWEPAHWIEYIADVEEAVCGREDCEIVAQYRCLNCGKYACG